MKISQTGTDKNKSKVKYQISKIRSSTILHFDFFILNSRRVGFTPLEKKSYPDSLTGFTLIELIIVVFIISLSMALIMPSFWTTEKSIIKSEARHISSTLRYIYDESVGKKQVYLLNINIDNKFWGFKSSKESRTFKIKDDIEIKDVIVPSNGEISRGELLIEFGPMGPEEPIILHLKKDNYEYTIIFNHLNGRTKILEGYTL